MPNDDAAFVEAWMARRGLAQFSYDDGASEELILDWIKQQGPARWHVYATGFNWDSGTEAARWIVDQPDCDRGTAIHLYYSAQPGFYRRFADAEAALEHDRFGGGVALMIAIATNWARGHYRDYRFAPEDIGGRMPETEAARLDLAQALPWDVPEDLARTGVEGVTLDWLSSHEGLSAELDAAIQARYEPWDDYKQATGTEDVFDVARRLGETEMPSDDTPANSRAMWANYILALNSFGAGSEHMALIAKPDLGGTGIPIG